MSLGTSRTKRPRQFLEMGLTIVVPVVVAAVETVFGGPGGARSHRRDQVIVDRATLGVQETDRRTERDRVAGPQPGHGVAVIGDVGVGGNAFAI